MKNIIKALWILSFTILPTTASAQFMRNPDYKYDTTTNICFHSNENVYSTYIGQKIIFYAKNKPQTEEMEYASCFRLLKPDTIWNKKRKNPKERRDYYTYSEYAHIAHGRVGTPLSAIWGHEFTIIDYAFKKLDVLYREDALRGENTLVFTLESRAGVKFNWIIKDEFYLYSAFPCIIKSYYDAIKTKYIEKEFVLKNNESELTLKSLDTDEYIKTRTSSKFVGIHGDPFVFKCTDVKFATIQYSNQYPVLIFTNKLGSNTAIRFTDMPNVFEEYSSFSRENFNFSGTGHISQFEPYEEYAKRKNEEELVRQNKLSEAQNRKKQDSLEQIQEIKQAKLAQRKRVADREKFRVDCIAKYGARIGQMIANGEIEIGMTTDQCILAWGRPNAINETTTANETSAQWVYYNNGYLYFNNKGILVTIQRTR